MVEPLGNHHTIVRVEDPLLADCMTDAKDRTAQDLTAERVRVDHRANIGVRQEIHNVVLAGLDIYFDFGKACT